MSLRTLLTIVMFLAALSFSTLAKAQIAPFGLRGYPNSGSVTLYWNPVPGATSYKVYRGTHAGGEGPVAVGNPGGSGFTDSGLTNGTRYFYKVTALYNTAESVRSSEASATPGTSPLSSVVAVARALSGSVVLAWSSNPAATGYQVFRYDPYLGWQEIGTSSALTFTDGTVTNGVNYMYLVTPYSADGEGNNSNQPTATPGDTPLTAPSGSWSFAGSTNASVYWNRVPGAVSYNIYRSTGSGGEGNSPYYVGAGSGGFSDSGLTSGTTYYYKIAPVDASGEGTQSVEVSVTPGTGALPAPSLSTAATTTSVKVNWTAVAGSTYYDLFRSIGDQSHYQLYKRQSTTSFTDSAITAGTTYYYVVYAGTKDGLGSASATESARPGSPSLSSTSGIYVVANNGSDSLYWNAVPGAQSYNVYRSTIAGKETLYYVGAGGTSFSDSGITNGTTYYYKITSVFIDGEGRISAEASGTPGTARLPASNLDGTLVSGKSTLTWGTVTGATSYNLFRYVLNTGWTLLKLGIKPTGTNNFVTYTDSLASSGTNYQYLVDAVSKDGSGLNSNTVFVTPGSVAPAAPTGVYAVANSTYNYVYWNPVPGATAYNVYRSKTAGGEGNVPIATGSGGAPFYDPNVTPGTIYYYTVAASDQDAQGPQSLETSADPGSAPLTAAILNVAVTATQINLNWSAVTGASTYIILRYDPSTSVWTTLSTGVTSTSYSDTAVTAGVNYSYYIYADAKNGIGSRSNTVTGTPGSTPIPAPAGLAAISSSTSDTVYWNPVVGATKYYVYRSAAPAGEGTVPIAVDVTGTAYSDSNVSLGTTYYYKVTALDADNQSILSEEVSVTPNTALISAPTLTLTPGTGKITLSWSATVGATGYNLYRRDPSTGVYYMIQHVTTGKTYSDTAIIKGATYSYYVAAYDKNGQGNNSSVLSGHD